MLTEIATVVRSLVGHDYLYFDTALEVKLSPHNWPVNLWAVTVSPNDEVYVMDGGEEWHKVEETDALIIPSLYQRIKQLKKQIAA